MLIHQGLVDHLDREGIAFCLIGGLALAAWGVGRFTADVDLLSVDPRVLDHTCWVRGGFPGATIRIGDHEDPLGGVVRLDCDPPHDVILGKGHAARTALERRVEGAGLPCPVADPLGLILLKLEAGAPQDAYDVLSLLAAGRALGILALETEVEGHLPLLSPEARQVWSRLRSLG